MVTKSFGRHKFDDKKRFDQIVTSMAKVNPPLVEQIKIYFNHCKLNGY
jgi:hypothetical protein